MHAAAMRTWPAGRPTGRRAAGSAGIPCRQHRAPACRRASIGEYFTSLSLRPQRKDHAHLCTGLPRDRPHRVWMTAGRRPAVPRPPTTALDSSRGMLPPRRRTRMSRLLLSLLLSLAWCVQAAEPPAVPGPAATAGDAAPPSPAQVLAIPPALAALLQARVIAPTGSREERLQRLAEMIFDRDGMDLQYEPDATYTVAETWQHRRANCLSFTLLFVTLARAAGVQARVQEVEQVVSWYQEAGVLY